MKSFNVKQYQPKAMHLSKTVNVGHKLQKQTGIQTSYICYQREPKAANPPMKFNSFIIDKEQPHNY